MTEISIIVPVYNCEKYLKKCIDSIVAQTFKNIEIILVDDGSKDFSYDICKYYKEKDSRIILIHQKNCGAWSARNTGLSIATGRYIGFVDSDDYIENNMYEKLYNAAIQTDADITMCQAISHNRLGAVSYSYSSFNSGERLDRKVIENQVLPLLLAPENEYDIGKKLIESMWCRIFKKKLLINNQICFKNHANGQDALFTIEATCKSNSMVIINDYLYHYRNDIGITLSKTYTEDRYDRLIALKNDIVKVLKENRVYNECLEKRINQLKRHSVFWVARVIVSKRNNQSFKNKIMALNSLLNRKETIKAFRDVNLSILPFQQKMLYGIIKSKLTLILYIAIKFKYKT